MVGCYCKLQAAVLGTKQYGESLRKVDGISLVFTYINIQGVHMGLKTVKI